MTDKETIKDSKVEQAEQLRTTLRKQTNETITLLQYAVDAELTSEEEQSYLNRKLLNHVDTSIGP